MNSLIFKIIVDVAPGTQDDRRTHDKLLQAAIGLGPLSISLPVLKQLPALVVRSESFPCIIGRIANGFRVIDIGNERSYSIALDLGTTNLAAILYDNVSHKEILRRTLENPQIAFGSDILSRMHTTMTGSGDAVYRALRQGINDLITGLCRDAGISPEEIHGLSVAGNTVMTHYFLGLDISTIPVAPYIPVVRSPGFQSASELGLMVNTGALVYIFPNAGSYVGGDITAGILASGMHLSDDVSILIDVGTNAEVVIGNRDWMIAGAGAAGPALEEGIARIGKRANSGIVYDVEISNGNISCKTFDNAVPGGICGSGMISLVYELSVSGMIDRRGIIVESEYSTLVNGEQALRIVCGIDEPLFLTQSELSNFMRSKAAMFTLLLVLTRSVGVTFRDIRRVFVSGALGAGINADKAMGIGMLPAWPASVLQPLGNSSLEGARMVLADSGLVDAAERLVDTITYKHMHDDPEFMREFRGAVFIPHTNPELLKVR